MKVVNTTKKTNKNKEISDEDFDVLRQLIQDAMDDPQGFVVCPPDVSIDIISDGSIIIKKDRQTFGVKKDRFVA